MPVSFLSTLVGMAQNTKGSVDGFLADFNAAVDADDYTAAKKALIKADVAHQALPQTTLTSFRGDLSKAWDLLEKLNQGSLSSDVRGLAGLRNKRRSSR